MSVFAMVLALCLWVCLRIRLHCVFVCTCEFACIVFMCVLAISLVLCLCVCLRVRLLAEKAANYLHRILAPLSTRFGRDWEATIVKRQFMMFSNWIGCEYMAALLVPSQNELSSFDPRVLYIVSRQPDPNIFDTSTNKYSELAHTFCSQIFCRFK